MYHNSTVTLLQFPLSLLFKVINVGTVRDTRTDREMDGTPIERHSGLGETFLRGPFGENMFEYF